MTPDAVARTIQLVLAPVVVVSASSIFVGGLLAHYTNLSDRIRALTAERRDLARRVASAGVDADALNTDRLVQIDVELPDLTHRHRLLHHAVLAIYLAILILVASMVLMAVAGVAPVDWLMGVVVVVFVSGVLVMLLGVALVALEVRTSHRALEFEVRQVLAVDRVAGCTRPTSLPASARLNRRVRHGDETR